MKHLFVFHTRLPKCRVLPNRYIRYIRVFMSDCWSCCGPLLSDAAVFRHELEGHSNGFVGVVTFPVIIQHPSIRVRH